MLKNKIIVKKIRNIFILLMAIIIMLGVYHNIRNSRAENVIQIEVEVSDKDNILSAQTVIVDATETTDGKYLLDLPTSVNGNIVTKYYTSDGEEILMKSESNAGENNTTESNVATIQLTEAEVANKKIQVQTDYDKKEVTANNETTVLYNKELQNTPNEDGTQNQDVTVTGYMPLNAQLEVTEIDLATLTSVKLPNEKQTMQKAYEVSIFEMVEKQKTETTPAENTPTEETNTTATTQSETDNTTSKSEIDNTATQGEEENTAETTNTITTTQVETENTTIENTETERVEYDPSVYGEKITVKTKYVQTDVITTIYNLSENNQVTEIESTTNEEYVNFESDKADKSLRYIIATETNTEEDGTNSTDTADTENTIEQTIPTTIEKEGWKILDTSTEKTKSTLTLKAPKGEELTEEYIKVIVNGQEVTEGITKTISDPEKLDDGIKYTITVTGFSQDAYQVKIGIEPKSSKLQMFSMADDTTTSDDSGIMLLATTYNTLKISNTETEWGSAFLGSSSTLYRGAISSVTFQNSTSNAASNKWDVSAAGDGSILAWYTGSQPYYRVFIGSSSTIYANSDSSYLFSYVGYNSNETDQVVNLHLLNTSNVTNMSYMFYNFGDRYTTTLNLGNHFDTSNVTNMSHMFENCGRSKIKSLT